MVRIAVGSENPTKVEGVKLAFKQFFNEVEVFARNVESGVPSQPFDDEVIRGAMNRAKKSYSEDFDFSAGIEAGLMRVEGTITGYLDFQVAVVYDGERFGIGFGPGFEFPPAVVAEVLKGREVGEVMEEVTGVEKIGRRYGAIYYLTKGIVSRVELSRLAVTMALIPFINFDEYFS